MFGIDDAIAQVSGLVNTIVTRVWPDATEVEKTKIQQISSEIQDQYSLALGQLEINKVEAQSTSRFVAGWRPMVGWVGALGLGYQILFMPIMNGILLFFGIPNPFASVDITLLQTTLGTILGLGVARSYDKAKGVDTKEVGTPTYTSPKIKDSESALDAVNRIINNK